MYSLKIEILISFLRSSCLLTEPPPSLFCFHAAPCKPCGDAEILLAACTSDFGESADLPFLFLPLSQSRCERWCRRCRRCCCFNRSSLSVCSVARGSIRTVEREAERTSVAVDVSRLHRQKSQVFAPGGVRVRRWSGSIKMPLQCAAKAGEGDFLFTGQVRFGEAWMGCAPRYKDFLRLYEEARRRRSNPCQLDVD